MVPNTRWMVAGLALVMLACLACNDVDVQRRVADCTPTDEEQIATHPQAAALSQLLTRAVKGGLPGALMAVEEDGLVWYGAAGVPDLDEPERPFVTCHILPIKSVTKSFVAVRAMQLVQAGELGLDAPLDSLLSASQLEDLPTTGIQLRHLLDHTSGLRHYPEVLGYVTDFFNRPDRAQSRAQALDAVRGLDRYFEPGSDFHYANTNTLLVQAIIEQHTGRRLETELREAVWEPLGLTRTHLHQDEPLSNHVPIGYMDLYGNGDAYRIAELDDVASGAGGMESTLADLLRFSRGLFESDRLVNDETRALMTDVRPVDEARWRYDSVGLGLKHWRTPLGDAFGHTGEDTGYKAYWHYIPARKLTWVLLLNANYGRFETRAERLREQVLRLLANP